MPSVCHQSAISLQSVSHQYAPPVEVRLVHAHRDGRQLPGRRRKPKEAVREPASRDSAEAGKLQTMLPCKCEHAILRPQVDERVLDLDEWKSVALSGNQWHSVALRGTLWDSKALHGEQWRVLDLVRRERQALVHHELAQVRRVEVACGRLAKEPFALERE